MSRFLALLAGAAARLPMSIGKGLRPGVGEDADSPTLRMRRSFVYHLHPLQVTRRSLAVSTTFGLGIITAALFGVLGFTGGLLMLYYVPTPAGALASTHDIQYAVSFGGFVRALHRWAGHGMVLTVFLHLVRVCLTGAYARRELNFVIGLGLFLSTLGLAFTGYLLPWDQLSFWAVTVSANLLDHLPAIGPVAKTALLGGDTVGGAALIRFYTLHVAVLPTALLLLVVFHLWRLRKDGGLARADDGTDREEMVPAWPHLVLREGTLILLVLTVAAWAALVFTAPLGGAPDLFRPSNPEKTPWYFLFLQEMVSYSVPVGGMVFPGLIAAGCLLLPFVDRDTGTAGIWLGGPRERVAFMVSFAVAVVAFTVFEAVYLSPGVTAWLGASSPWVRDILNPASGMLLLSALTFFGFGAAFGTLRGASLAAAAVILVAVLGFSVMGACRGPGWIFYWPWEAWPHV